MHLLYFLYNGEEIIYIGRAKGLTNLKLRLTYHKRNKHFTDHLYYEVNDYEECKKLERMNIKHYTPKYNKQCVPGRVKRNWEVSQT